MSCFLSGFALLNQGVVGNSRKPGLDSGYGGKGEAAMPRGGSAEMRPQRQRTDLGIDEVIRVMIPAIRDILWSSN